MARELIVKDVDGKRYEFEQFTTTVAIKTLSKLTKIFGESITIAATAYLSKMKLDPVTKLPVSESAEKSSLESVDKDAISRAVKVLIEKLDETEIVDLVKRLTTEGVLCEYKAVSFDQHFRGETLHLFNVLIAAIEAQFGGFFDAVSKTLPGTMKQTAQ